MSKDDLAITHIEKRQTGESAPGGAYAYEVTGVVDGQERKGLVDAPTFERLAREGQAHLDRVLKEGLRHLTDQ